MNFLEGRGILTRGGIGVGSGPKVIGTYHVPRSSGFTTAYNVVSIPAFTRQLGRLASETTPLISDSFAAVEFTGTIFEAVNLNFSFEFIFEDGSSGLWTFNERHELDAIPDKFVDSDDNDIPDTASMWLA